MRRSLIVFAFGYFIIDTIYYLIGCGFPFNGPQWALVALLVVMAVLMGYQIKLMEDHTDILQEPETEEQGEEPEEEPAESEGPSKYDN